VFPLINLQREYFKSEIAGIGGGATHLKPLMAYELLGDQLWNGKYLTMIVVWSWELSGVGIELWDATFACLL